MTRWKSPVWCLYGRKKKQLPTLNREYQTRRFAYLIKNKLETFKLVLEYENEAAAAVHVAVAFCAACLKSVGTDMQIDMDIHEFVADAPRKEPPPPARPRVEWTRPKLLFNKEIFNKIHRDALFAQTVFVYFRIHDRQTNAPMKITSMDKQRWAKNSFCCLANGIYAIFSPN